MQFRAPKRKQGPPSPAYTLLSLSTGTHMADEELVPAQRSTQLAWTDCECCLGSDGQRTESGQCEHVRQVAIDATLTSSGEKRSVTFADEMSPDHQRRRAVSAEKAVPRQRRATGFRIPEFLRFGFDGKGNVDARVEADQEETRDRLSELLNSAERTFTHEIPAAFGFEHSSKTRSKSEGSLVADLKVDEDLPTIHGTPVSSAPEGTIEVDGQLYIDSNHVTLDISPPSTTIEYGCSVDIDSTLEEAHVNNLEAHTYEDSSIAAPQPDMSTAIHAGEDVSASVEINGERRQEHSGNEKKKSSLRKMFGFGSKDDHEDVKIDSTQSQSKGVKFELNIDETSATSPVKGVDLSSAIKFHNDSAIAVEAADIQVNEPHVEAEIPSASRMLATEETIELTVVAEVECEAPLSDVVDGESSVIEVDLSAVDPSLPDEISEDTKSTGFFTRFFRSSSKSKIALPDQSGNENVDLSAEVNTPDVEQQQDIVSETPEEVDIAIKKEGETSEKLPVVGVVEGEVDVKQVASIDTVDHPQTDDGVTFDTGSVQPSVELSDVEESVKDEKNKSFSLTKFIFGGPDKKRVETNLEIKTDQSIEVEIKEIDQDVAIEDDINHEPVVSGETGIIASSINDESIKDNIDENIQLNGTIKNGATKSFNNVISTELDEEEMEATGEAERHDAHEMPSTPEVATEVKPKRFGFLKLFGLGSDANSDAIDNTSPVSSDDGYDGGLLTPIMEEDANSRMDGEVSAGVGGEVVSAGVEEVCTEAKGETDKASTLLEYEASPEFDKRNAVVEVDVPDVPSVTQKGDQFADAIGEAEGNVDGGGGGGKSSSRSSEKSFFNFNFSPFKSSKTETVPTTTNAEATNDAEEEQAGIGEHDTSLQRNISLSEGNVDENKEIDCEVKIELQKVELRKEKVELEVHANTELDIKHEVSSTDIHCDVDAKPVHQINGIANGDVEISDKEREAIPDEETEETGFFSFKFSPFKSPSKRSAR